MSDPASRDEGSKGESKTAHVGDLLVDLAMGFLPQADGAEASAHLAECAECAGRYSALTAASAAVSLALPPVRPKRALRARVLASVDHLDRFAPFAPRLAAMADISSNEARRALHIFARPEEMPRASIPGMRASPLPRGPRLAGATARLVSFAPGISVPRHTHIGEERVLVFQGAFETDDGHVVRAGEELRCNAGTTHSIKLILGDEPCLCVIINDRGVEFS